MARQLRICLLCQQEKMIAGRGLCLPCYKRERRAGRLENYASKNGAFAKYGHHPGVKQKAIDKICIDCGELGKHGGRGLCRRCYQRHKKTNTLDNFPRTNIKGNKSGRCEDCKKWVNELLKGKCRRCYGLFRSKLPEVKKRHAEIEKQRRIILGDKHKLRERERNKRRSHSQSQYRADYYRKHKDQLREKKREWEKRNPEVVNAYSIKKRMRRRNAQGDFTPEQWAKIVEYYCPDEKCLCCKNKFDKQNKRMSVTIDHVIPLGEPYGGTNNPDNLQPLCHSCNSAKGTRHFTDYRPDNGAFARSLMVNQ